jgi:hypothetical protein
MTQHAKAVKAFNKALDANAPIDLSSGRAVFFRPEPNGSRFAYGFPGREELTQSEYDEFVAKMLARETKLSGVNPITLHA